MDNNSYLCINGESVDVNKSFNEWKFNELLKNENILNLEFFQILISILLFALTLFIFTILARKKNITEKFSFLIFLYHSLFCIFFYIFTFFYVNDASTYYYYSLFDYDCDFLKNRFGYYNTLFFVNILVELGLNYFNIFIIFNFIGSIGILYLYLALKILTKNNSHNIVYLFIFFPSLHFWSSSIGKDAIIFCCLSILFYLILNKNKYFFILLFITLIFLIRPYIAIIIIVSLSFHLFFIKNVSIQIKSLIVSLFLLIIIFFNRNLTDFVYFNDNLSLEGIINYINIRRYYSSLNSFNEINIFNALIDTILFLFKPISINLQSKFIIISSIENILLLIISLYIFSKIRIKSFYNSIKRDYAFFYCYFVLTLIPIAITTLNYGQIVRFKIMIIGVYFIFLVSIYNKYINNN